MQYLSFFAVIYLDFVAERFWHFCEVDWMRRNYVKMSEGCMAYYETDLQYPASHSPDLERSIHKI